MQKDRGIEVVMVAICFTGMPVMVVAAWLYRFMVGP